VRLRAARAAALAVALGLIAIGPSWSAAQTPVPPATATPHAPAITPLVSTEWLARELARPALVVLQIGTAESFAAAHIPGAIRLDFDKVIVAPPVEGGLRMELPEATALQAALRALGVNEGTRVVLVFAQSSAFLPASRAFFTLEWAGLAGHVAVLDGGLAAWRAEGRVVATGAGRTPVAGNVTLAAQPSRVVSREQVIEYSRGNGPRLVDARTPEVFSGERSGGMAADGHIPSAINLPFSAVTTADGKLRSRAELETIVAAAGVGPDETTVAYCNTGFQASWLYLALRVLGREVSLYDGSFDEWSRDAALPRGEVTTARP
jgi:thiosulfate/3-mercaptopyruvate sulfurtransferase